MTRILESQMVHKKGLVRTHSSIGSISKVFLYTNLMQLILRKWKRNRLKRALCDTGVGVGEKVAFLALLQEGGQ